MSTTAVAVNSRKPSKFFCDREFVRKTFAGKSVALVGSGPGVMDNDPGYIDSFDVVMRINNHKLIPPATGSRTDVFYSFFGSSIRKRGRDLLREGVKLCMCKCPDAKFMDSAWHESHKKPNGVDFRYIYTARESWWFCPTYVPTLDEFMEHFRTLDGHVPTTGFSALLDVLSFNPSAVYMTGFDFFTSKVHNVNERWIKGDDSDPIGHTPNAERAWLQKNATSHAITMDKRLRRALA